MVKVKEFALGWVIKLNVIFFPVTLGVYLSTGLVRECVKAWRVPKESLDSAEGICSRLGVLVDMFFVSY